MSHKVKPNTPKFTGFGLVRDKDGKPKINNYQGCSEQIKAMLTPQERNFFEKQERI